MNYFIIKAEKRDKMREKECIIKLSNAFGPSGFEDDVIEYAKTQVRDVCTLKEDHMRNLYMELPAEEKETTVLLDAHSDEVGFIVQAVKPNGTLRFLPLGGWDPKNIIGNKVWIKNKDNELINGVVCSKPPHFMKDGEKGKSIDFDDLLIDVGATSAQELMEVYRIGIGSPVVPSVECEYNEKQKTFMGKGFDCRIGCAALLETMQELDSKKLHTKVVATLTSQEEVGERGMACAIHNVKPDIVICFEGCPADDTFEEPYMIQSGMKKGVMLRHFDRSMITNPRFQRFALEIAEKYGIHVQESVRKGGGTNGGITHTAYEGIPTIVIGVPVRYAHSCYGICAYDDYREAVELAKHIIEDISSQDILSF